MRSETPRKFFGSQRGWLNAALLTLTIAALCAMAALLIDKAVALWVPDHLNKEWRAAFNAITDLGKAEPYILAALAAWGLGALFARIYRGLAIQTFYRALSRLGGFVIASLALSGALIHILKLAMGRARPGQLLRHDIYQFDFLAFERKLNSFPSGHSQTISAVIIPLALVFPKARNWLIGFAVVVAASRVMVSAHFPADVLAGSYIAIMSALFLHQHWFADLTVPNPRTLKTTKNESAS